MDLTLICITWFRRLVVKNYFLYSLSICSTRPQTRKNRCHQRKNRQTKTKSDDDPAGALKIKGIILSAEFVSLNKLGFFSMYGYSTGCRSPPDVLRFSDFQKSENGGQAYGRKRAYIYFDSQKVQDTCE